MMETLPLSKVRKVIDYWNEITLTYEQREQRMREEGDKLAKEALENIMSGKVDLTANQSETKASPNSDPSTLERFLSLDLDPKMLKMEIK